MCIKQVHVINLHMKGRDKKEVIEEIARDVLIGPEFWWTKAGYM